MGATHRMKPERCTREQISFANITFGTSVPWVPT